MTKPHTWRGCLNQMLIPYLHRGCTPGCSPVPVGSPLPLVWGWGEGAGGGGCPGTASPPAGTRCWLGARVPHAPPPPERQAGSVMSVARIEMVGRAGQMAEGGKMVERAEY